MNEEYESRRTIIDVFDMETGEVINSVDFFKKPESEIFQYRRRLQEAIDGYAKPKFVCFYCNQLLRLAGKETERGRVSFFSHLHDSDDCEIKTDREYKLTKEQILALKFSKIRESERHKNWFRLCRLFQLNGGQHAGMSVIWNTPGRGQYAGMTEKSKD